MYKCTCTNTNVHVRIIKGPDMCPVLCKSYCANPSCTG